MDQWLVAQGFVKDAGTEFGGFQPGPYGTESSVMATYRRQDPDTPQNAVIDCIEGYDAPHHRIAIYHIMITYVDDIGIHHALDYHYDDQTKSIVTGGGSSGRSFWAIAGAWGECTLAGCGGAATACAIGNMIDGETGFGACFGGWCAGAGVGCAINTAFGR